MPYDAVIFDMDGVVTDTASVHAARLEASCSTRSSPTRATRRRRCIGAVRRDADYRRYVDGRTREDGVATLPRRPRDRASVRRARRPAGTWTVHGLAARKNELSSRRLAATGVRAFPARSRCCAGSGQVACRVGLVTASRNADGRAEPRPASQTCSTWSSTASDAAELGLAGKPDPAMFLEAARRLGVDPARAVVVEDAVAGVAGGHARGGFGLVVGVDRGGHRADARGRRRGRRSSATSPSSTSVPCAPDPWLLVYDGFDPAHEGHRRRSPRSATATSAPAGRRRSAPPTACTIPAPTSPGSTTGSPARSHGREVEDENLVNVPELAAARPAPRRRDVVVARAA